MRLFAAALTVALGVTIVTGALDRDVAATLVRRDPSLAGQVKIALDVAADGSVASTSLLESTFPAGSELTSCIVARAGRFRFPVAQGATHIEQVYVFRP